jgi:hypothetical protein
MDEDADSNKKSVSFTDSMTKKQDKESIKIVPAVPHPEPEPDPNVPRDRDVCVGLESTHKATMLLRDLIRIHFFLLWKKKRLAGKKSDGDNGSSLSTAADDALKPSPQDEKEIEELAARLTTLFSEGKKYELSGLKDVPKPFLKGPGRFFQKGEAENEWKRLDEEQSKMIVADLIRAQFEEIAAEPHNAEVKECVDLLFEDYKVKADEEPHSAPRPCDVLFLPIEYPWEENMAYEHQSGNKHLLFLAAQNVSGDSRESEKRVESAFKLVTSKVEVNNGNDVVEKTPRFVIQLLQEESQNNTWDEMPLEDLAEFAAGFVFEVFLEKQIHDTSGTSLSAHIAIVAQDSVEMSEPIETPTTHDVLFGRG